MFMLTMPATFRIGDTADCKINRKPARVTWTGKTTLLIEPDDPRAIMLIDEGPEGMCFVCGDRGMSRKDAARAVVTGLGEALFVLYPPAGDGK